MANIIKIKSSGTSSNVPGALENGEIAINYADGDIFYKNSSGSIKVFKTTPAIISNTAPTTDIKDGYLWFDTTTNNLYIRSSSAWVEATNGSIIALTDLSDVVLNAPEEFQTLGYDGTNWVNSYSSTVTYVRNAEATTLTTGTAVYLFGATGDHASVKRADNDSDTTSSKTIGLVGANILPSENGPVITRGYVDGIDLSTGYAAGDILWLGEDGAFTKTKPSSPEHLVFIGVVVRATVNGIIYVATQNGYELDELHDVSIVDKQSGDFLKYNGSLWINDPINLGTDTVGNYMSDVSAGTGITVTHTPSEGSTATIAANIGTTSTTLASGDRGLPTGGTTGQILAKTSGTNYDDAWRDPYVKQTSARFFDTNGAYIQNGTGLILAGAGTNYASSPAISGTYNTISVTFRLNITTRNAGAYHCLYNRDLNLVLYTSYFGFDPRVQWKDSTGVQRDTNYMAPYLSTTAGMSWLRYTIDATGPNTTVTIETAADSATEPTSWTLHNSVTVNGVSGILLAAVSQIGVWAANSQHFIGTVSRVIERRNGSIVVDADFSAQTSNILAFTESSSSATVSIVTSRYTFGIPCNQMIGTTSVNVGADSIYYSPMLITEPVSIDMVAFDITSTPAAARNQRFAIFAVDSNMQPTGSALLDTGSISVDAIASYSKLISPAVTLQPGLYLVAWNRSGTTQIRTYRTPGYGSSFFAGANPILLRTIATGSPYANFPSVLTPWNSYNNSTTGNEHPCRFRWSPA